MDKKRFPIQTVDHGPKNHLTPLKRLKLRRLHNASKQIIETKAYFCVIPISYIGIP